MKGNSYANDNYLLFPIERDVWPSLDENTRRQVIDQVARLLLKNREVETPSADRPQQKGEPT